MLKAASNKQRIQDGIFLTSTPLNIEADINEARLITEQGQEAQVEAIISPDIIALG